MRGMCYGDMDDIALYLWFMSLGSKAYKVFGI